MTCDVCAYFAAEGWWGRGRTHCRGCHRTWGLATVAAHCTRCCAHFTTPRNFDLHLTPTGCRAPDTVRTKAGATYLEQRPDGVWQAPGDGVWVAEVRAEGDLRG